MKTIHTLPVGYSPRTNLLAERVILVTGAGDGIGRAAAHSFAAHGATVILLGKTQAKLELVYDEILAAGHPEPMILPLDLQYLTPDTAQAIADTIDEELGRLDSFRRTSHRNQYRINTRPHQLSDDRTR